MSFHNIRQTKTFEFVYKLLELLFLALVGLYLFYRVARITTFGLVFPTDFEGNLLIVMTVVAVLRLFSTPLRRWKTLAALGFALVYCLVYRSDGYRFLLFLAVMTVGLIDIDYRKILRVYVASVGIISSCAVFAGIIGVITNLVYTGVGRGLRSAWGIAYPTDFATLIFFILLALWILAEKCPAWVMLFPCAAFVMMARFIAYSKNSTVCGAVFMLAILYCTFERQIVDRRPGLCWVKRGVNRRREHPIRIDVLAIIGSGIVFALMLIIITWLVRNGFGKDYSYLQRMVSYDFVVAPAFVGLIALLGLVSYARTRMCKAIAKVSSFSYSFFWDSFLYGIGQNEYMKDMLCRTTRCAS